MNRVFVGIAVLGVSACTYQVESLPPEPAPVVTAYADKVPGKWALLVDTSQATATPQANDMTCSQFGYTLDMTKAIGEITAKTFAEVTDNVRFFDHQLTHAELASGGYAGTIVVRLTEYKTGIKVEGQIDGEVTANTEMTATILVTKGDRRMVDASETGLGEAHRDAGLTCHGAVDAMSAASDEATQDVVHKLAEQFANSHDIRYSAPGSTP